MVVTFSRLRPFSSGEPSSGSFGEAFSGDQVWFLPERFAGEASFTSSLAKRWSYLSEHDSGDNFVQKDF